MLSSYTAISCQTHKKLILHCGLLRLRAKPIDLVYLYLSWCASSVGTYCQKAVSASHKRSSSSMRLGTLRQHSARNDNGKLGIFHIVLSGLSLACQSTSEEEDGMGVCWVEWGKIGCGGVRADGFWEGGGFSSKRILTPFLDLISWCGSIQPYASYLVSAGPNRFSHAVEAYPQVREQLFLYSEKTSTTVLSHHRMQ